MLLAARGGRHQPLAELGIGRVGLLGQGRQGQADGQPGKGKEHSDSHGLLLGI